MTGRGARSGPPPPPQRWRSAVGGAGALLLVGVLVPPLGSLARRYELAEAVQFSALAVAVPALLALGATWARLGATAGPLGRLAAGRRRHPELVRALAFMALDLVVIVAWHSPAAADAVARRGWPALVEAVCLVGAGIGLWLELVASPPLAPRLAQPWRALPAALSMWAIWAMAYIVGLSSTGWYHSFGHLGGRGAGGPADQEFAIIVLWFAAAAAFAPVVFVDVLQWLQREEEDPDHELRGLVRAERRRGGWARPERWGAGGPGAAPPVP